MPREKLSEEERRRRSNEAKTRYILKHHGKYQKECNKKYHEVYTVYFNRITDMDIIALLAGMPSRSAYIRSVIRRDMEQGNELERFIRYESEREYERQNGLDKKK